MIFLFVLEVVLWGFVIRAIANYDPATDPGCNLDDCETCPFPCEKHGQ